MLCQFLSTFLRTITIPSGAFHRALRLEIRFYCECEILYMRSLHRAEHHNVIDPRVHYTTAKMTFDLE